MRPSGKHVVDQSSISKSSIRIGGPSSLSDILRLEFFVGLRQGESKTKSEASSNALAMPENEPYALASQCS